MQDNHVTVGHGLDKTVYMCKHDAVYASFVHMLAIYSLVHDLPECAASKPFSIQLSALQSGAWSKM